MTYASAREQIERSLRLGIEVESDDESLAWIVGSLTERQIIWIAEWLAGDGFIHSDDREESS